MIACRRMSVAERLDVFELLSPVRTDDLALGRALTLFVEREDYGFIWVASDESEHLVGCALVSYAISTEAGGLVAKLDDVVVVAGARGAGIGTAMLDALADHLRTMEIVSMETNVARALHLAPFFTACGFVHHDDEGFSRAI